MRWAASTSGYQPSSQPRASLPGAKNANCRPASRSASGSDGSALALMAARTSGGLGAWPTLAATRQTARTSSGRSVASMRATRLPKAWPTTSAGPLRSCSITAATSAARSCRSIPVIGPRLCPIPRGSGRKTRKSGLRQPQPDHIEIGGAAAERRQQDREGPSPCARISICVSPRTMTVRVTACAATFLPLFR